MFMQLTCLNFLLIYGPLILTKINIKNEMFISVGTGTVLIGASSFIGALSTIFLLRILGKRVSVVGGFFGCGFSYLFAAVSFTFGFKDGTLIGMCIMILFW